MSGAGSFVVKPKTVHMSNNFSLASGGYQSAISAQALISDYELAIEGGSKNVTAYLENNVQIKELPESISGIIRHVFYQLNNEISNYFNHDEAQLLKRLRSVYKQYVSVSGQQNRTYLKECRLLVCNIVRRVRELMCDYAKSNDWSKEFRECIAEFFALENNMKKWIETEEKASATMLSDREVSNYIATAC
jgi:hypothetical protein